MTKGRKTTQDERVEIVSFCIANGKEYGLTMEKFGVSYQQIYSWVRKYEEHGVDELMDKRGNLTKGLVDWNSPIIRNFSIKDFEYIPLHQQLSYIYYNYKTNNISISRL